MFGGTVVESAGTPSLPKSSSLEVWITIAAWPVSKRAFEQNALMQNGTCVSSHEPMPFGSAGPLLASATRVVNRAIVAASGSIVIVPVAPPYTGIARTYCMFVPIAAIGLAISVFAFARMPTPRIAGN